MNRDTYTPRQLARRLKKTGETIILEVKPMTHDEWWEKQDLSQLSYVPKTTILAFKAISQKAWSASCECPKCGTDLKVYFCRNCYTYMRK